MTTIVIDWNNSTLYTDSRASWGEVKSKWTGKVKHESGFSDDYLKIWRTKDPYRFFTGTGAVRDIERFIKTKKNKHLKSTIVWEIDAKARRVISHKSYGSEDITDCSKFVANGSGSSCFETAMNFTDDVKEAMSKITDPYTGGKIQSYKIDWSYLYEDVH